MKKYISLLVVLVMGLSFQFADAANYKHTKTLRHGSRGNGVMLLCVAHALRLLTLPREIQCTSPVLMDVVTNPTLILLDQPLKSSLDRMELLRVMVPRNGRLKVTGLSVRETWGLSEEQMQTWRSNLMMLYHV